MSRHRDVRCMNYSDEYDGYDDVYGHSMEDDYCVSPSAEQFLFDRSKQQNIASFITEPDIVEDNEDIDESSSSLNEDKYNLSELEKAKLIFCLEAIRNIIGDAVPESKLKEKIITSNFDTDVALDAILKESSPKNDPVISKERLERYPGVSVDKPNTFMFTIPKLSFEKKDNLLKDSTSTAYCHLNNIDNSSNEKRSLGTFSSLAGLISHHTESIHSDTAKITSQNNMDTQCFGSLAALTAHHLQKSSANVEFREKEQLPNSQFVIPKLSMKKNDNTNVKNIQSLKLHNNSKKQSVHANSKHPINLLEKNFSDMYISLENNDVTNVESKKQFKDPINVVNEVRTPSPDNWMIDLSTALKEAEFLTDCISNANLTASKKFYYDMPNLEMCIEDNKNSVISNTLPVTINLCALRHIELPYTKKNVSVFGRTLCRKWKTKKPVLKIPIQCYDTVKSFDFSTPYQRYPNRS